MADEDLPISLLPPTTTANDADYFVIVQDGVTKKIAHSDLFSSTGGISSINTLTSANQLLSVGTSGTAPNWASAGAIHTLNIPYAGGTGVTLGGISKSDYDSFANKQAALGYTPVNVAGDTMLGDLTLFADPTNAYHAATKNYVDGLITGIKWKESVKVATTANITLSGTQTIDGVSCGVGDRVLVKNQSTASQNGIYVVASGSWSRATDNDTGAEIIASAVYVQAGGTVNGSTQWANSNSSAITIGSTSITYSQIAGVGVYTAGSGLSLSAGVFSISAGGVTNTMLAGSIATSKLSSTNLNSLDSLSYSSTSFVKMTASGTFALDTNTYLTASGLNSSYIPYYNGSALVDSKLTVTTNNLTYTESGNAIFKVQSGGIGIIRINGTSGSILDMNGDSSNTIRMFTSNAQTTQTGQIDVSTTTFTLRGYGTTVSLTDGTNSYRLISGDAFIQASNHYIRDASGNQYMKISSVGTYIGTSSISSSAIFQVDSTTKGFLGIPRMTNAQRLAITVSTSTIGLIVYCTDTTEGLYIYKSGGWTFII